MQNLDVRTIVIGVASLALILAAIVFIFLRRGSPPTDGGAFVAEPNKPALLPVRRGASGGGALSLDVMSYVPPKQGGVQAVVTIRGSAPDEGQEIGRFTIFPNEPFTAPDAEGAMRFSFELNETSRRALDFEGAQAVVTLEPVGGGSAEGARLEFVQAVIDG